jgi:neutral ceramidase
MLFGVAAQNVTPDRPIHLAGYASRTEKCDGVYQDLFVKAFALQHNTENKPAVIVTSDLLYFDDLIIDQVEQRLREAGLDPVQLLITASHTHCAPIVRRRDGEIYGGLDDRYIAQVVDGIVRVVHAALADMSDCTLRYHRTRCDFNINRRVVTEDGVNMAPNPEGVIDRDVDILSARTMSGDVRAVLFGFTCHPTTMGGDLVGGDYPGFAQRMIQAAYPGAEALFVQGCAGDIRPNNVDLETGGFKSGPLEVVEGYGRRLGRAVVEVIDRTGEDVEGSVVSGRTVVDLPLQPAPPREEFEKFLHDTSVHRRRWAEENINAIDNGIPLPTHVPTSVQSLKIGDNFAMVTLAGEVCVEIGLRIKDIIGEGPRFVLGYSNRVHWYIPSRQILREGGYEADSYFYHGVPSPYDESVEDLLVEAAETLLRAE